MGSRLRALGADIPVDEHRRALNRFESACEQMLEDEEKGAAAIYSVSIKTKGKRGWIPRGLAYLVSEAHTVILFMLAELRRRDALLREAHALVEHFNRKVMWDEERVEMNYRAEAFLDNERIKLIASED